MPQKEISTIIFRDKCKSNPANSNSIYSVWQELKNKICKENIVQTIKNIGYLML